MSFMSFVKKNLIDYFIIVTGVNIAIAVLGMNYKPEELLGYDAFFSPLILGAVAVLPSFVFYSRRELSLRQMLIRRVIHLVVLELTLVGFGYIARLLTGLNITISFVLIVFAVYVFTLIIRWIIDSKTALEINLGLKRIQE
jgi:uncharacterized membrane protein YesL